jgi:hypothetical protein
MRSAKRETRGVAAAGDAAAFGFADSLFGDRVAPEANVSNNAAAENRSLAARLEMWCDVLAMKFDWDADKAEANLAHHKVSF